MTEQAHVVAGIDNAGLHNSVIDYACWIASTVSVPLTLLHNIEHNQPPVMSDLSGSLGLGAREALMDELIDLEARRSRLLLVQSNTLLNEAKQRAQSAGLEDVRTTQRHGYFTETLLDIEDTIRVLVLGIRGEDHDEQKSGLGTQIEAIIRALHKPVLVVNGSFKQPHRLMLAYDGSDASEKALSWLTTSPLYKEMECHVVHVCTGDDQAGQTLLSHAKSELAQAGVSATTELMRGNTQQALLDYQQQHNIDLLVMGSFGHSRLHDLVLGSFTVKMLNHAKIPLLLLR